MLLKVIIISGVKNVGNVFPKRQFCSLTVLFTLMLALMYAHSVGKHSNNLVHFTYTASVTFLTK